jgi:hypothetical protein
VAADLLSAGCPRSASDEAKHLGMAGNGELMVIFWDCNGKIYEIYRVFSNVAYQSGIGIDDDGIMDDHPAGMSPKNGLNHPWYPKLSFPQQKIQGEIQSIPLWNAASNKSNMLNLQHETTAFHAIKPPSLMISLNRGQAHYQLITFLGKGRSIPRAHRLHLSDVKEVDQQRTYGFQPNGIYGSMNRYISTTNRMEVGFNVLFPNCSPGPHWYLHFVLWMVTRMLG